MVDLQFYQKWSLSLNKFLNTSSHLTPKPKKYHSFHIFSYLEEICWNTYLKRLKQGAGHCFDDLYERWISVYFFSCYMNFFSSNEHKKANCPVVQRSARGNLKGQEKIIALGRKISTKVSNWNSSRV